MNSSRCSLFKPSLQRLYSRTCRWSVRVDLAEGWRKLQGDGRHITPSAPDSLEL